jgi:hypothetical protein
MGREVGASATIETTLYDIIVTLSDDMAPEEDVLVTALVVDLFNSGQAKFVDGPVQYTVQCA